MCVRACSETTIIGRALFFQNRRKMIFCAGGSRPPRPGGTVRGIISHTFDQFSAPWVIPEKFYFAQSERVFSEFCAGWDCSPSFGPNNFFPWGCDRTWSKLGRIQEKKNYFKTFSHCVTGSIFFQF
jgi:hypothetical protein